MCMMLYIASDNELPVISQNGENGSFLNVSDIPESCSAVNKHFTKQHRYIVTAGPMGCACGFLFYSAEEIDDISQNDEAGRKVISDLFDYIKEYVSEDHCELYSCWTTDEKLDAEHKDVIKISEFDWKDKFSFLQKQYITVYK